jgi:hypothetical protein
MDGKSGPLAARNPDARGTGSWPLLALLHNLSIASRQRPVKVTIAQKAHRDGIASLSVTARTEAQVQATATINCKDHRAVAVTPAPSGCSLAVKWRRNGASYVSFIPWISSRFFQTSRMTSTA